MVSSYAGPQSGLGGLKSWRDGYATTVATRASDIRTTDVSPDAVTVSLTLAASDLDACGDMVEQTFAGTWTLEQVGGKLLGSAFNVDKTGGGTPVLDASGCSEPGRGPMPTGAAGCDPNYTGCVPPYPPDADCIDVRETVEVVGEDVHNLDLGGDGRACELW